MVVDATKMLNFAPIRKPQQTLKTKRPYLKSNCIR